MQVRPRHGRLAPPPPAGAEHDRRIKRMTFLAREGLGRALSEENVSSTATRYATEHTHVTYCLNAAMEWMGPRVPRHDMDTCLARGHLDVKMCGLEGRTAWSHGESL